MTAPDRIWVEPAWAITFKDRATMRGEGFEYTRIDPNTRIVTVDQLRQWLAAIWSAEDVDYEGEIRAIIGDVM